MLALSSPAICGFHAPITTVPTRAAVSMETKADLEALAKDLNPVVGYWDPLNLLDLNLWGQGEAATIGWFRESEIKHGRIAMAGFLGWITHSNNIRMQGMAPDVQSIPTGLSAPEVWDAMPDIAKWQIIVFVGVLDTWRENRVVLAAEGQTHYMKGGTPGYFPTFDMIPHPVPFNLYDPFGVMKYKTEEQKARGRLVELNNGRLAMIGLFGFVAEAQVPGSVPFLKGVIAPYAGDVMAPLTENAFTLNGHALF
jgi:hypothetical protein